MDGEGKKLKRDFIVLAEKMADCDSFSREKVPIESERRRKREELEASVEHALREDELDQLLQLIPAEELKNHNPEKAFAFLAKELGGSFKEDDHEDADAEVEQSVEIVLLTFEGFTGRGTRSPVACSKGGWKKCKTELKCRSIGGCMGL